MNNWLLKNLLQLFNSLNNLSVDDAPRIQRFLGFYHEVLKEQAKKQLTTSKNQFNKVGKDHLLAVARVWQYFNE
mgnify:CR=1 FL=1